MSEHDGAPASWETLNRDLLVAELNVLRARLRGRPAGGPSEDSPAIEDAEAALVDARRGIRIDTALDQLSAGFGLTPFERALLLLTAGPELVAEVGEELRTAGGSPRVTFGLGMAALPEAHWSAITPSGPLRRWNLIELLDPSSPTNSPLMIDERVLHQLVGAGHLDAGLSIVSRPVPAPEWLPEAFKTAAQAVLAAWGQDRMVLLHGPQADNIRAVAAAAANGAGLSLLEIAAADLPADPGARERMLRLMERESVLAGRAWAIDIEGGSGEDVAARCRALGGVDAPVVLIGGVADLPRGADAVPIQVERLAISGRRELLRHELIRVGVAVDEALSHDAAVAAGVFDLSLRGAAAVAIEVGAGTPLWTACLHQVRRSFDGLASVRTPKAGWDQLVLPAGQLEQLHALVAAARNRHIVLDDWGFADRTLRGLGSTALFAGPSGTGKTLAAEVIAHELGVDLVQVDLSVVVSKYIGETEKQLRRLFDAAEDGGVVLLFDEADTLFGKRTEVKDSHDRYANLEVGYLLQRMESFHGLAILTTNSRSALDVAFQRRLQTIVSFPYPDRAARETMWRTAFPAGVPLEDIDVTVLAALDLSGGGIAAAALVSSYLCAEEQSASVGLAHVRAAARWELAKSNRVNI